MNGRKILCGCWVFCQFCGKVQGVAYSSYKKKEGKYPCPNCYENCLLCKKDNGRVVFCGEHELQSKTVKPIIKPTVRAIEEYYQRPYLGKKKDVFKKAYYLNDDYLIIEYKPNPPLADRDVYTTNSEGLFLGYEDIVGNSPLTEAIEIAKEQIQQTLNKLNVKVNQLSEKFWNWSTKITELTSTKEVKEFLNQIIQASEKQFIEQQNPPSKPPTKPNNFPYWIFIPISLSVVAIVVGTFIYRRKRRKKLK